MDKSPSGPGVAQGPEQAVAGKAAAREALPWLAGQTLPSPAGRNPQRMHDEGEIARGGMGSIHKLHDPQLRRHVAVKVLDPKLARDPEHARRFVDEARIMGALGHPNIVPVHDLSTDEKGRVSYTMKLIEGRTLSVLINEQASRRDLERILRCLATVCDVLAFAHSRQIIHRDIKPDNIMVDDFGQVYLMDWGSALVKGDRSLVDGAVEPEGTVAGTVRYMAPEQARGEISRIDGRTDVFAVGAILYKALSGKAPYEGNTRATLEAARRAEYRPLEECPGVAVKPPPMLMAIARKAMAADPARRHQTAAELAEDLRDFMQAGDWFALHVFPIGKVIVREGDWADAAYIITDGRCEVRHRDPKDPRREVALRVLGPGDVFGETAIFADAPRSATVVALEEVRAVMLDRAALEQLAASTYLGKFVKALAGRFLELEAKAQQPPATAATPQR